MSASLAGVVLFVSGMFVMLVTSTFCRPVGADGRRRRTRTGIVLTVVAAVCLAAGLELLRPRE